MAKELRPARRRTDQGPAQARTPGRLTPNSRWVTGPQHSRGGGLGAFRGSWAGCWAATSSGARESAWNRRGPRGWPCRCGRPRRGRSGSGRTRSGWRSRGNRCGRGVDPRQVRGRPARSLLRTPGGAAGCLPDGGPLPARGRRVCGRVLAGRRPGHSGRHTAGTGIAGIAVVVVAGVLVSGWHRLGNQGPQVTFTALFALLLGGHQPFAYITHRLVDVGIGVATGLAVNVLVFPPLQLRPAEHAISQWGNDIARAWPGPDVVRPGLRRDAPASRRSRPPARRPAIFPAPRRTDRRPRLPAPTRAGNSAAARSQRCAQRRTTPRPADQ